MAVADFVAVTIAVRKVLVARGPLSGQELLDELAQAGIDLGEGREDLLTEVLVQDDMAFVAVPDDRWGWAPALLDGRIFTCRLTAAEAAGDFIELGPDLLAVYPLWLLPEFRDLDRLQTGVLVDGMAMETALVERGVDSGAITRGGAAVFPRGRFDGVGVGVGDVVGIRAAASGLEVERVAKPLALDLSVELARLVDGVGEPEELHELVWRLCADNDAAFRAPVAPVTELAAAAGLALSPVTGEQVAAAGFNWNAWLRRG